MDELGAIEEEDLAGFGGSDSVIGGKINKSRNSSMDLTITQ